MKELIWLGPLVVTLWLGVLSAVARTWWFAGYLGAVGLGFAVLPLITEWPAFLRELYAWTWVVYVLVLPVVRIVRRGLYLKRKYNGS